MDTEIKRQVAELLKSGDRKALAEMLVEFVQPSHITTDFVGMLLNTRSLKPGDSLVKKLRKGISVHTLVPGSIPLANEITVTDRVNYILDGSVVKVTCDEWELEAGEIGTVEEIKREMTLKLKDHYQNKVFTALTTIWTAGNTPDNYTSLGTAVTATALEDAIDRINETTPGAKAVVGTRAAMTPITKFGAFWSDGGTQWTEYPEAVREIYERGMIGKYYGVPLVVIDQIYDNLEDNATMLPTDKILVIGENVGEFITYGPERSSEYSDVRTIPPRWAFQVYQQTGMLVWNAQGIYCIGGIV
jgi:hypothetical protein